MSARFELLVRGRFVPIPEARIDHVRANAWRVHLDRTPELERRLRGALDQREIVAGLDGVESTQAMITAESADAWTLVLLQP